MIPAWISNHMLSKLGDKITYFIHSQTSTAAPLKFGKGQIILSHRNINVSKVGSRLSPNRSVRTAALLRKSASKTWFYFCYGHLWFQDAFVLKVPLRRNWERRSFNTCCRTYRVTHGQWQGQPDNKHFAFEVYDLMTSLTFSASVTNAFIHNPTSL